MGLTNVTGINLRLITRTLDFRRWAGLSPRQVGMRTGFSIVSKVLIIFLKYFLQFSDLVFEYFNIEEKLNITIYTIYVREVPMVSYVIKGNPTVNPGDVIAKEPQTIEEKATQLAVDLHDITGAPVKVPAYFIVKYPNGETKALHHIKDAEEISDVIRQMKFYEQEETLEAAEMIRKSNLSGLLVVLGVSLVILFLFTIVIAIGIF